MWSSGSRPARRPSPSFKGDYGRPSKTPVVVDLLTPPLRRCGDGGSRWASAGPRPSPPMAPGVKTIFSGSNRIIAAFIRHILSRSNKIARGRFPGCGSTDRDPSCDQPSTMRSSGRRQNGTLTSMSQGSCTDHGPAATRRPLPRRTPRLISFSRPKHSECLGPSERGAAHFVVTLPGERQDHSADVPDVVR
jgi:hypothetical protein